MKYILSFLSLIILYNFHAQNYNLDQVGYLDLCSDHSTQASDIWGWVDSEGNEYAIVGLNNGTSIVDVTDPANPVEVFFEPGTSSIWRDIKTYGCHAYVTTEAREGLLIIDLSTLPNDTNLKTTYWTPPGTINGDKLSAHNIFIDEFGTCYLFGANKGNKGALMLDLSNPEQPVEIGKADAWYAHDGVAKNNILYLGNVYAGHLSIFDVSDKSTPVLLGVKTTPNSFSHNVWFSDDQNYLYNTDEVSGAYIVEYDISDPSDIKETDRIRTTLADNVIPHNTHFINDYLVTSYYRDGVIIHDVSNKGNMVEVARYDTSPSFSGNGFNGCWGVYPFLPSGNIIASDIENGLHVLKANFDMGISSLFGKKTCPLSLSVNEEGGNLLSISPNPVSNQFNIKGELPLDAKISISNILGEEVYSLSNISSKIILPNTMTIGVYFVSITQNDKVLHHQKIVKE